MAEAVVNGVRLHYQRLGQRLERSNGSASPQVLFLHGLVMDNLSSFYFTLGGAVAKEGEAILVDLRGHGLSERPVAGYDLETLVADLRGLLEALQITGRLHLVGNSFGGLLALALAAQLGDQTASVVLLDAHLGRPGWGEAMAATLSLRGAARDQAIAEGFRHWLGRDSQRKSHRLAATATALVEGTSLLAELRSSPPLADEALRRVRCPVLALYGEQSDLKAQAEALPSLVPDVSLRFRPQSTHSLLWEETEWVKEQLLAWLREH